MAPSMGLELHNVLVVNSEASHCWCNIFMMCYSDKGFYISYVVFRQFVLGYLEGQIAFCVNKSDVLVQNWMSQHAIQ